MRGLTYVAILATMWFPSGAIAASHFIADCAGNAEIANAHVGRVEKNGAPDSLAGRALSRLRAMAMAGPVQIEILN